MSQVPPIISAIQVTPKRQFVANTNYFESIANNFYKNGIVIPVLERFPMIPELRNKNELNANYLILKSHRGAMFFFAEALQNHNEYIALLKERALQDAIAKRFQFRMDVEDKLNRKHWDKIYEDSKRNTQHRFEEINERNIASREKFLFLIQQSFKRTKEFTSIRNTFYDKRFADMRQHFWKMVYKNLEKVPKELPLSGSSLQSILHGLSYTSEQATLLRVLSEVIKNRLKINATQIVQHLAGNSVPEELRGMMNTRFHRATFEKLMRSEVKEFYYEEYVKDNKKFIDDLLKKYCEIKFERIQGVEERIDKYWEIINAILVKLDETHYQDRNLKVAGTKSGRRHSNKGGWKSFNSEYIGSTQTSKSLDRSFMSFYPQKEANTFQTDLTWKTNFMYGLVWDAVFIKGKLEYKAQKNSYEPQLSKKNQSSQFQPETKAQLSFAQLSALPRLAEQNLSEYPDSWKFKFRDMGGLFTSKVSMDNSAGGSLNSGEAETARTQSFLKSQVAQKMKTDLNANYESSGSENQEFEVQLQKTYENSLDQVTTTSRLAYEINKQMIQRSEMAQIWAPIRVKTEKDNKKK